MNPSDVKDNVLPRLVLAARRAVERGDMVVGRVADFPGVREWARLMDIPIGVFGGMVLLRLKAPRRAVNAEGREVGIVSWFDGVYYGITGDEYSANELAWVQDKELPACSND